MMARRGALGLLAGGVAAFLGGCGLLGSNSYRFRMTVEVETPDGLRTGSSVYEVEAFATSELITGGGSSDSTVRGEAVAVDLPGGRTLFALLKTVGTAGQDDLAFMSMRAFDPAFNYNRAESARRIRSGDGIRSPVEAPRSDYPLLVTFADVGDPKTVELIAADNLAASFGAGVRLKRIILEVTDDSVSEMIEVRLASLGIQEGHGLDRTRGVTANPTLAQKLAYQDFLRR